MNGSVSMIKDIIEVVGKFLFYTPEKYLEILFKSTLTYKNRLNYLQLNDEVKLWRHGDLHLGILVVNIIF